MSAVCVGSTHDSTAWSVSKLGIKLRAAGMKRNYWLAGDAASDCNDGVLTPWPQSKVNDDDSAVESDSFNYYLSSTRMHVEQCFGILMARFGIFWRPFRFNLRKVPVILHACMILHNFFIDNNAPMMDTTMSGQERQRTEQAFEAW
jgi:hypothetical protein